MTKIRKATINDVDLILDFIHELAIYEKEPEAVKATKEDIIRDGFSEEKYFHVLIAEIENIPVGFSLYFYNYSTWLGKKGIHLEDLFVLPKYRGKGVGKKLLSEIAKIAVEKKCGRVQWQVLDWNKNAIDFYESLKAYNLKEWYTYRLDGNNINILASST